MPKAGPLSSKDSSGSDSPAAPAASPPELIEVVIRKGAPNCTLLDVASSV